MSKPRDFIWRVVRCAYHRRKRAMAVLKADGYEIHDSYLSGGRVHEFEEYTIVAKRRATKDELAKAS